MNSQKNISSIGIGEYYERVLRSRILSEDQLKEMLDRIPSRETDLFVEDLIKTGHLNRFQANFLAENPELPLVFDRYVITGELGKGGMGVVYRAVHLQMDRAVAIKVLSTSYVDSNEKVDRFKREVRAAARLVHPNVVTAYDAAEDNGFHFLVMELVEGQNLNDVVRDSGRIEPSEAIECIRQAANGLANAHELGIVHRDIKPSNILLSKRGIVKILDMGLARIFNDSDAEIELTKSGMVMGSLSFMAPEQAANPRLADERSDIYSLGCTFFFLLTGKPPFKGENALETLIAHRESEIPKIELGNPTLNREVNQLFRRMVAKDPLKRFKTVRCVIQDIELFRSLHLPKERDDTLPQSQNGEDTITLVQNELAPQIVKPRLNQRSEKQKKRMTAAFAGVIVVSIICLSWFLFIPKNGRLEIVVQGKETDGLFILVDGMEVNAKKLAENRYLISIPDPKESHDLLVKIVGYVDYHEQVSFDTSLRKTIFVDPLLSDSLGIDSTDNNPTASGDGDFAVKVSSQEGFIEVPTLEFPLSGPITIEFFLKDVDQEKSGGREVVATFGPMRIFRNSSINRTDFEFKNSSEFQSVTNASHGGFKCHIAAVFDGKSKISLYLNGIKDEHLNETNLPDKNIDAEIKSRRFSLFLDENGFDAPYTGLVDEVRISNCIRYRENFFPKSRLKADENTLLLFHFDRQSSESIIDSSRGHHHGKSSGTIKVQVNEEMKPRDQNDK